MKKLKFWSRKKRKRKQACPSQPHHCSNEYSSLAAAGSYEYSSLAAAGSYEYFSLAAGLPVEPTAPPLSFWLDESQSFCQPEETSTFPWNTQLPSQQEETIVEANPLLLSQVSDLRIYQSYQQYMVPNPTNDVPIVEPHVATTAKRSVGIFGCVIELSSSLVRCFIP
ncbi:hypothetical protein CARUB_v10005905mg [Capsella rubella]|uniref:Uncharacterized protein n=2 Tax=Capsella rubella TaxID=81985 RepID=R0F7L0_9BRAS|nr:hypothetical protein CARUB_v10005905mg [Capsella rubella]